MVAYGVIAAERNASLQASLDATGSGWES